MTDALFSPQSSKAAHCQCMSAARCFRAELQEFGRAVLLSQPDALVQVRPQQATATIYRLTQPKLLQRSASPVGKGLLSE